jgi:hypothetical protein
VAVVTIKPFGRGSQVSIQEQVLDPYTGLYNLSNTGLDGSNFHPQASINEDFFAWDQHTHKDGSLGDSVIRTQNLQNTFAGYLGTASNAECMLARSSKTLCIWGMQKCYKEYLLRGTGTVVNKRVFFAESSEQRQGFPPGTSVAVHVSCYLDEVDSNIPFGVFAANVDYDGFDTFVTYPAGALLVIAYSSFYVNYFAIGTAPGLLQRPEG